MGGFVSVIASPKRFPTTKPPAKATLAAARPVTADAELAASETAAPVAAAAQVEDVLRRNMGRASTVTSSYRGVLLTPEELTPTRKTLLGE